MPESAIKLRTVFMGTSDFSDKILKSLFEKEYNIVGVYTKPDKKIGREQKVQEPQVKLTATEKKVSVFQPTKFDEATIQQLKDLKPDLIIVVAYGKILPPEVLSIPGFGCINVHASLLPKYRGPSPIQNAILNGEKETGITIMLMDEGVDTGDILSQEALSLGKDDFLPEVNEKMSCLASKLLLKTIPQWIERKIKPKKQDGSQATFCQLIERSDGKIIWTEEAQNIYNKFRAFYPWPGIHAFWETEGVQPKRIKFNKISFVENISENHRLGEVFQLEEQILVKAEKGSISIQEIQLEGKPNMKIKDFINGYAPFLGSILK